MFNETNPHSLAVEIQTRILDRLQRFIRPEYESIMVFEYQSRTQDDLDHFVVRKICKRRNAIYACKLTLDMIQQRDWSDNLHSILEEGLERNRGDLDSWLAVVTLGN